MISIVIPVYNVERYLRHCLDSVVQQVYTDIQVVCVDDGSTDNCLAILKEYAARDSRVSIVSQANQGLSGARNTGLEHATGEYIMFLDADDWLDIDTCERALELLRKNDADVVLWGYNKEYGSHCSSVRVWKETRIFGENEMPDLRRRLVGLVDQELAHVEWQDSLGTAWGKLIKRSLYSEHGIRYVDLREIGSGEDVLVNIELFTHAEKVVYTPDIIHHYRKDNTSALTKTYKPRLEEQWMALFSRMEHLIDVLTFAPNTMQALTHRKALAIIDLGLNILCAQKGFRASWREIRWQLNAAWYRKSVSHLPLRFFPLHWKVFFFCAKYRLTLGVLLLLIIIRRLISK